MNIYREPESFRIQTIHNTMIHILINSNIIPFRCSRYFATITNICINGST